MPLARLGFLALTIASPAVAQTLPDTVQGTWDVSTAACRTPGTSMTQIDITPTVIDTYGGDAQIVEVEPTGPVTFVAADFLQLEGAAEIGPRERTYYRLTQRNGADRLTFKWADIQTVELVRCAIPRD